jgi:hypothetical protein
MLKSHWERYGRSHLIRWALGLCLEWCLLSRELYSFSLNAHQEKLLIHKLYNPASYTLHFPGGYSVYRLTSPSTTPRFESLGLFCPPTEQTEPSISFVSQVSYLFGHIIHNLSRYSIKLYSSTWRAKWISSIVHNVSLKLNTFSGFVILAFIIWSFNVNLDTFLRNFISVVYKLCCCI